MRLPSCAGILFFLPLILEQIVGTATSPSLLALLTTGPFGLSALFVWLNARHSRLTGASPPSLQIGPLLASPAI